LSKRSPELNSEIASREQVECVRRAEKLRNEQSQLRQGIFRQHRPRADVWRVRVFGGAIGKAKPFAFSTMQHIVQRMRQATGKVDYVEALAH
jgi:hypothetical protein